MGYDMPRPLQRMENIHPEGGGEGVLRTEGVGGVQHDTFLRGH